MLSPSHLILTGASQAVVVLLEESKRIMDGAPQEYAPQVRMITTALEEATDPIPIMALLITCCGGSR